MYKTPVISLYIYLFYLDILIINIKFLYRRNTNFLLNSNLSFVPRALFISHGGGAGTVRESWTLHIRDNP